MANKKIIKNNCGDPQQKAKNAAASNLSASPDQITGDPIKKRGRPKGSTDKTIRKQRTDNNLQTAEPGQNSKVNRFGMSLYNLPLINVDDIDQVKNRISDYFAICDKYDIKPTVASLAMAFNISRITLFTWITGKYHGVKNQECLNQIKRAYDYIGTMYETYLNNGSMNPVSAFFLMKNNYGYKDVTDYVVTANQEQNVSLPDIVQRSGLLSE